MYTLRINWSNEIKNCVPFAIFVNGQHSGIIKRGQIQEVTVQQGPTELYFVPQAPKFFGWRALKLETAVYGPAPEMFLSILADPNSFTSMSYQLRCRQALDMEILRAEYVKKYR